MNDAQILAELIARRGAAWVVSAVEILNAVVPHPSDYGRQQMERGAVTAIADTYEPPADEPPDARVVVTNAPGILPAVDPWDPAVNPDVEARGPGWVKMKRPPTQSEALAADPDRDFGNGPGVQVDADGNVSLAPIPPMPYIEPTIDFGSRSGVGVDKTGYEGA